MYTTFTSEKCYTFKDENYPSSTNQTRRRLLEKQGRTHLWCTPMDPAYGQAKAGRPARTYIQQLCEDTGCRPEDLPEAMNDRQKWREIVRDIHASGTTWWWWLCINRSIMTNCISCLDNNGVKVQQFGKMGEKTLSYFISPRVFSAVQS